MGSGIELATAYVSLVVDTAKIPDQIKGGFRGAPALARSSGKDMGSEMGKGVSETFRSGIESALGELPMANIVTGALGRGVIGGATAVAATAGGVIAAGLTKGFERLEAIDTAKGKLTALGHSAQEVAGIMNSALASVKGTAFSLGDAATLSASAVAAGIKPGQELTKYLSLVADAAAVSGSSLMDIGRIMDQVNTTNRAYTRELNELAIRGLPIFKWLADEYHTNEDGLRKMVEAGKVDAQHFEEAISTHIGGAAVKSGATFRGSLNNMNAALSRAGAAFLQPFFERIHNGFNDSTSILDKYDSKLATLGKSADTKIFDDWAPKIKQAYDELKANPEAQTLFTDIRDEIAQISNTARQALPSVQKIIESLAQGAGSGGALGFKVAIQAVNTVLNALTPTLNFVSGLMQEGQGAVTALVSAYLSLKAVSKVQDFIAPVGAAVQNFGAKAEQAGGKAAYLGNAAKNFLGKAALAGAIVGLSDLSQKTNEFGEKSDTAKASSIGLDATMGAMAGSTIGPWGTAIGGAAGALLGFAQNMGSSNEMAKLLNDSLREQRTLLDQDTGAITEQNLDKTAEKLGASRINQAGQFGFSRTGYVRAASGLDESYRNKINDQLGKSLMNDPVIQGYADEANASIGDYVKALQGRDGYAAKIGQSQRELDEVRDGLKNNPAEQSAIDLSREMNTLAQATEKDSTDLQQYVKDTNGSFKATDSLKKSVQDLGGTIKDTPKKNVVEITAPPGADPDDFKKRVDDLHLGLTTLEADNKTVKVVIDDNQMNTEIQKIEEIQLPPKTLPITPLIQNELNPNPQIGPGLSNSTVPMIPLIHRANGGPGPVFGSGGPTSDSVPAMLSVKEHVWSAAETDAVGGHQNMARLRSMALAGKLRFATGGTPSGITEAVKAAQDMEGHKYVWGGSGPENFDCSGFIGFLQQVAMGLGRLTKRIYTTNTILEGATAGLKPGLGPSGTWFRVGVSQEHMAATIADLHAESGGALGTSGIGGGRAGAEDSQFPYKFYLPNELIAGYSNQISGGHVVEWTPQDEDELLRDQDEIAKARQKRDQVYANVTPDGKPAHYTQADQALADADVQAAIDRTTKKQQQKDQHNAGVIEGGSRIAPQAPALQKHYNEQEKTHSKLLQAVEAANQKRNEVYDNPDVYSQDDREEADIELQTAIENLQSGSDSSGTQPKSVRDVVTGFASNLAGVAFDAFKAQLPDQIGSSHWWDVGDKALALANDGKTNSVQQALSGLPSFGIQQFLNQLGYNPNAGVPDWVQKLEAPGTNGVASTKKKPKVFDSGGWLEPGEMGINLSSKPEPIFNSPAQLRAFAGQNMQPAQSGLSAHDVERMIAARPVNHYHVSSVDELLQKQRVETRRQRMTFKRR